MNSMENTGWCATPGRRSIGAPSAPQTVAIHVDTDEARRVVERFIHRCFAVAYDADVRYFMPMLLSLRDPQAQLQGVLGFRPAAAGDLFLERYLDVEIEDALSSRLGGGIRRDQVMEVGNLATTLPGGARWLIAALTAYLHGADYRWAVFTAVPALGNSFARLGIELVTLAPADIARLTPAEQALWGRYYDTGPMVVAANVQQSFEALARYMGDTQDAARMRPLWDHAFAVGMAA
jgi:hypothetical protein